MPDSLLLNSLIIFGVAIGLVLVFHRIRVPAIVGFFVTGLLVGPHGFGLIKSGHGMGILGEIGVVLLLFTIGIGLSFETLLRMKNPAFFGGSVQILLSVLMGFLLASRAGLSFGQAMFIGFLISHSSTIIMLRIFQTRGEVETPHARISLGIAIFQDIMTVPMMLLIPVLAGGRVHNGESPFFILGKGIGIILLALAAGRYVVRPLLFQIVRTRSRELFLLTLITVCLAVAGLTSAAGLSLALGAFLAGLIISESEFTHQALGDLSPFRDVFTSFFFISVGMLLNLRVFLDQAFLIFALAVLVLFLKAGVFTLTVMVLKYPLRTGILTGLAMCQIGEFSFVLSRAGLDYHLISDEFYQVFLAVIVLTMSVTPFLMSWAPRIAEYVTQRIGARSSGPPAPAGEKFQRTDHLVIIGFGINGRNLARAARAAGIDHVILEMNPDTVHRESRRGQPIVFGDGTQQTVLEQIGVRRARVIVVAISDPVATRTIVRNGRDLNPTARVIARTRYVQEVETLHKLGADEVIPEEFETSVEIFTRVLRRYLVPDDQIEKFVDEVRSDSYEIFRKPVHTSASLADLRLNLPDIEIVTLRLDSESPVVGQSLAEADLRKRYGVNLLAIRRNGNILSNPAADTRLAAGDFLILLGKPDSLRAVADQLKSTVE